MLEPVRQFKRLVNGSFGIHLGRLARPPYQVIVDLRRFKVCGKCGLRFLAGTNHDVINLELFGFAFMFDGQPTIVD